ncbi:hydroxymethylbilane synthase [Clostridium formicaceticum]|uniref:Porphobilinogen deaminase n=1 Tax=Clostridium formicaceticum TaxID=1497 RepID=A0AAC9WEK7_9CLOT|nr:hydroxymethylbilane synthase [Clostridium formicaceticum]AOY75453.1 hydroxymethylbilane synthase [Clostridium formicaceticum]ARE85738.1 Porphobilinogen deaminase [Clostridium formicaceticum]
MRKIRIGSRASELALVQAEMIMKMLKEKFPQYDYEIIKIKTLGDKILDKTLSKIGGKGLFVKEIQAALLEESIDLAVHSMKDMPAESPEGLMLAAITEREDPRDVLVIRNGKTLKDIPLNAFIGTSSLRRKAQLLNLRKDVVLKDIRGNVATRLSKIDTEGLEAVILAAAGLKRLGYDDSKFYYLDIETFTPAVGQGALGCEIRRSDKMLYDMFQEINHQETYNCVMGERVFLKLLEGGCHVPIGAYGKKVGEELWITGMVASPDGSEIIRHREKGNFEDFLQVGRKLAEEMEKLGAKRLLSSCRN